MTTAFAGERLGVAKAGGVTDAPRPFRWTVEAYYRAAEAGAFGHEARLELIRGEIIEKMPPSPLHTSLGNIIADLLRAVLPTLTARVEGTIHIDLDGEPIPDVTAVSGGNHDFLSRHPSPAEVALLVEVAIPSADYDLAEKALLYAQASIPDYWVVLPNESVVVVYRGPTPNGYGRVIRLGEGETVTPLAGSDTKLMVRSLLGH